MRKSLARVAAREAGAKYYVPESPCERGHTLRRVSDGNCIECKRIKEGLRIALDVAKYNLRKKNERAKYRPLLAEKARIARDAESADKRAERLEKAKMKQREWRMKNPDHEGSKKAKQLYKELNPHKIRADTVKRRAAKMNRTPSWLTDDDLWMLEQAYEIAAVRSSTFGFSWHVDHVLPLQGKYVSGLHVPTNLQVIPWRDNVSKANKYLPA